MAHADKLALLAEVKSLAKRYRVEAERPLGVTGEVAEFEAARLLGLELAPVRQAGWDALDPKTGRRFQIKGRVLLNGTVAGQKLGSLSAQNEWDAVLVVILNAEYEAMGIWEADRASVLELLERPGSRAREERGQLGLQSVIKIGKPRWPLPAVSGDSREESPTRYAYTRLCFRADIIEPLEDDAYFEVDTPHGVFRMTKRQFRDDFANVVRSKSYIEGGIYHYPVVPQRALSYLL